MFKSEVLQGLLKVAASTIAFEDLSRYLPFQTRIVSGDTLNHIQSLYAYDVKTYGKPLWFGAPIHHEYIVSEGDTLCRRSGTNLMTRGGVMDDNCPGCLAIAQGIIKRDIENA
jgi:hypothetical protein